MKKVLFLLAIIFTTSSAFSQKRKRMYQANNLTSKQRTTLAVKKLTLALELDKKQAKKVAVLFNKMAKNRLEKGQKMRKESMEKREKLMKIKKASKDRADFKRRVEKAVKNGELKKEDLRMQRRRKPNFEAQNKALDQMIALQSEMKKILTPEQFEKYKKMKKRRVKSAKHKMDKRKKVMKKRKMEKHHKGERR